MTPVVPVMVVAGVAQPVFLAFDVATIGALSGAAVLVIAAIGAQIISIRNQGAQARAAERAELRAAEADRVAAAKQDLSIKQGEAIGHQNEVIHEVTNHSYSELKAELDAYRKAFALVVSKTLNVDPETLLPTAVVAAPAPAPPVVTVLPSVPTAADLDVPLEINVATRLERGTA